MADQPLLKQSYENLLPNLLPPPFHTPALVDAGNMNLAVLRRPAQLQQRCFVSAAWQWSRGRVCQLDHTWGSSRWLHGVVNHSTHARYQACVSGFGNQ